MMFHQQRIDLLTTNERIIRPIKNYCTKKKYNITIPLCIV